MIRVVASILIFERLKEVNCSRCRAYVFVIVGMFLRVHVGDTIHDDRLNNLEDVVRVTWIDSGETDKDLVISVNIISNIEQLSETTFSKKSIIINTKSNRCDTFIFESVSTFSNNSLDVFTF